MGEAVPHEMRMPSLGQTTDELRIVAWLKAEGERVKFGEPLLEVETDKAVLEVESAVAGTLLRILHSADETVVAGSVIAFIGAPGEALPNGSNNDAAGAANAATPVPVTTPVPDAAPPAPQGDKVLATPTARQMARELGVDLREVAGSGPQGRIEKRDVETHGKQLARPANDDSTETPAAPAARHSAPQPQPAEELPPAFGGDEHPVPRHRVVIAQRLLRSVQSIPQITLSVTVDMTRPRTAIARQRQRGAAGLTYTHLLLRAVAGALRRHPRINRVWLSDGPRYRQYARADVGLAIAADDNLLIATVPEPDRLSIAELAGHVEAVAERARRSALAQADLAPAAITLSNLGMHGVDEFHAIIDPDQSAILASGRVVEQTVVVNGGIYIVPQMKLNLTVDHRIADGVAAAEFLSCIRTELEAGEH